MDEWARSVHQARDVLRDEPSRMPVAFGPVRPVVYASWRRSRMQGLHPDRVAPVYRSDAGSDSQLIRTVTAVLEKHAHALTQSMSALSLTDEDGRMLKRWAPDPFMAKRLDGLDVVAGFSVDESTLGTSSTITLLSGNPILVRGPEHFNERFHQLSCAGAPIVHPVTRRLIGSLHLTCRLADTNNLVLSWVLDRVAEIEAALRVSSSHRERLLLDAYLTHNRDARHPLVALDQNTVITNAAAARLLAAIDQTMLWELAARSLREGTEQPRTLTLTDGTPVAFECRPVYDGAESIGAVVMVKPVAPGAARRAVEAPAQDLPGLVGGSARWKALCRQAAHLVDGLVLVVGEAGSGRLSVARAVVAPDLPRVMDAADVAATGHEQWLRDVDTQVTGPGEVLVLRHVDLLEPALARATESALRRRPPGQVLATSAVGPAFADLGNPVISGARSVLDVPPLRERLEDLPGLLDVFTARATAERTVHWLPDAVQALSRLDWSGNLTELEAVVQRLVAQLRTDYIGARDLPADIVARATGRRMARLERAEAQTIMLALRDADGNKQQAAESLGIARSTLYRKMRALGLDLPTAAY